MNIFKKKTSPKGETKRLFLDLHFASTRWIRSAHLDFSLDGGFDVYESFLCLQERKEFVSLDMVLILWRIFPSKLLFYQLGFCLFLFFPLLIPLIGYFESSSPNLMAVLLPRRCSQDEQKGNGSRHKG